MKEITKTLGLIGCATAIFLFVSEIPPEVAISDPAAGLRIGLPALNP